MTLSRSAGRLVAIILPLFLPLILLTFCTTASAQTVSLGWDGDGIFPKVGTTNSSYWIRVVYHDGTSQANNTPPISTFELQERAGNDLMQISMRPFLDPSGLSQVRGIMPSPQAGSLIGPSQPTDYLTTGSRPFLDIIVGSTVDPTIDYSGSDVEIRELKRQLDEKRRRKRGAN